jgi:hypothetical protein
MLFGLAPALRLTRIDWRGATSAIAGGLDRLRSVLLGVRVALSLGLIASAALLSRRGALFAASGANAGFTFADRYAYSLVVSGAGAGAAARRARRSDRRRRHARSYRQSSLALGPRAGRPVQRRP